VKARVGDARGLGQSNFPRSSALNPIRFDKSIDGRTVSRKTLFSHKELRPSRQSPMGQERSECAKMGALVLDVAKDERGRPTEEYDAFVLLLLFNSFKSRNIAQTSRAHRMIR